MIVRKIVCKFFRSQRTSKTRPLVADKFNFPSKHANFDSILFSNRTVMAVLVIGNPIQYHQ